MVKNAFTVNCGLQKYLHPLKIFHIHIFVNFFVNFYWNILWLINIIVR